MVLHARNIGLAWGTGKNFLLHRDIPDDRQVVAIENYGYSGSLPEVARRASQYGGQFFSFHADMNGDSRIVQAVDGKVVAFFEPLFVNNRDLSHPCRPAWVEDIEFPVEQVQAACLAAMEAQTGLLFDRAWLVAKLPTYRVPDPDEMLKDVVGARVP